MKLLLCILLLIASNSLHASSLVKDVSDVLQRYSFEFAIDSNIYCAPPQHKFSTDYPHADYLLNVASADSVVVFAHGFIPFRMGGKESLKEMVRDWKHHIGVLDDLSKSTAYCVVSWDSDYGFDHKDFTLSKFLTALDFAMRDKRLDQQVKNLTLVGHSAGGNYVKYSYLEMLDASSTVSDVTGRIPTKNLITRILTLSTPHLGSKVADSADTSSLFLYIGASLLFGEQGQVAGAILAQKARTRGAKQLRTIPNNRDLRSLNNRFRKVFPKERIVAIGGSSDTYVPLSSSTPDFTTSHKIRNFDHTDLLRPNKLSGFRQLLLTMYTSN